MDGKYDAKFSEIFEQENKSLNRFLDSIFGFFMRTSPETLFDNHKLYGKQILVSTYEKWHQIYRNKSNSQNNSEMKDSHSSNTLQGMLTPEDDPSDTTPRPRYPLTGTTNTTTTSRRNNDDHATSMTSSSKKDEKNEDNSLFDTTNGATLEHYSWNQTIDEIEVRVPVQNYIKKGTQVNVQITKTNLDVLVENEAKTLFLVLQGNLAQSVNVDECVWFLSPGLYISIMLEKSEARWWDRLLSTETPIDLDKIHAERSFSSIPDDEKMQIEKIVTDQQRKEKGELTSDQEKMRDILKKAWDAEGSPFKGQPFDPSVLQDAMNNANS